MQTIRRYANRKYYHLQGHRYVNLSEIAALIRAGQEVQAFAHPGGEEITTEVLAQIIAQESPAGLSSWLTSLIRWSQETWEEPWRSLADSLGLPSRAQWRALGKRIARLEELLEQLLESQADDVPR